MRAWLIIPILPVMLSGGALAEPPPVPCPCVAPAATEREPPPEIAALVEERQHLWRVVAGGLAVVALGQTMVGAYAIANRPGGDRALALVPVAGPIALGGRDQPGTAWGSVLGVSVFVQLVGTMIAVDAGAALNGLRVRPNLSVGRDGASLDMTARF